MKEENHKGMIRKKLVEFDVIILNGIFENHLLAAYFHNFLIDMFRSESLVIIYK